ncbi:MAG: FKBP-type peptidyl-prolyl cis-trans isomerase [Bacteroidota bacterium]|jgi:FKBP-type peptidyl-prolyl cis-trans isomerase FklB|nr:FKBP-type peptidyl-prolyl cis-trans isomerase [Bacteroidota bacterium]
MRFLSLFVAMLLLMSCENNAQQSRELTSRKDSVSYAIGLNIGQSFKSQNIEADPAMIAAAMNDVLNGAELKMTEEQGQQVWLSYQQELMAKMQEEQQKQGAVNKEAGEKFLAENKKKDGVVTTASGLQYKVVTMGDGPKPTSSDKVKVHYRGTLIDGKQFDSSYDRGEPAVFPVTGVIAGWTEVLQLMPVGSKWEVYIPSELAYGERGPSEDIGSNSTLIFTVELLGIEK